MMVSRFFVTPVLYQVLPKEKSPTSNRLGGVAGHREQRLVVEHRLTSGASRAVTTVNVSAGRVDHVCQKLVAFPVVPPGDDAGGVGTLHGSPLPGK